MVLHRDLRFALRGFRRSPGFFITAVVILAVGIGMSVAMFTVFRTVLVRRLPVVDQDRLAVMWTYRADPTADFAIGTKELSVVRAQSRTMRDIAAVAHWPAASTPFIYNGDRPVELNRGMVTGNFFQVLGVRPVLGRLFTPADDEPACPPAIAPHGALVLSYRAWQTAFGGDRSVIGRHLVEPLLQTDYTIVGVAPAGFDYPANDDYWIPMWCGWQSGVSSFAVARLAPGATVTAARNEYLSIERRLRPELDFRGAHAATFTETVLGNVRPVIGVLTAAVLLLLLIACLNVGNLLLLRASSRARELAIRRALGATSFDIVRQVFVEAVAIAAAGGALGFAAAAGLLDVLVRVAPSNLPRLDDIQLSGAPVLAAVAVTSLAVLVFGLAPALVSARGGFASPLRFDARSGSETRRRRAVRQTLVAAQVALAMVMLGGAALLARSLTRLESQDKGFASDHLSVMWYSWNARRDSTSQSMVALGDRIVRRVAQIPGVTSAAQIVAPPMLGNGVWVGAYDLEGAHPARENDFPSFPLDVVGPDFFKTLGVPLVRGRAFTEQDDATATGVAIVSEDAARRLWPGENPMGKRLRLHGMKPTDFGAGWRTVVGIARDTHLRTLRDASPIVYVPSLQYFWQGYVAVRSSVPLASLLPALRAAGTDVDPEVRLWNPQTMDEVLAGPLAQPRLGALLMSSFGVVALFLAAIGLFGVMASLVRDQTRELAIRIALGATPWRVRRDVLGRAATVVGAGALVGLVAALGTSHLLSSLLFDVKPTDPLALGGACVVLLAVAAAAAYVPARRATTVDPVQALRAD